MCSQTPANTGRLREPKHRIRITVNHMEHGVCVCVCNPFCLLFLKECDHMQPRPPLNVVQVIGS